MPTPTPELLARIQHLSEARQAAWLRRWSAALLQGDPPPEPPIDVREVQRHFRQLLQTAGELHRLTGRRFTLDGHMVGSYGEVIAADRFGLELATPSTKGTDSHTADGRPVEVKATCGTSVALRGQEPAKGLHLLVLQIGSDGEAETIYNGPAELAWDAIRDKLMPSNGQRRISIPLLRKLQDQVEIGARLAEIP